MFRLFLILFLSVSFAFSASADSGEKRKGKYDDDDLYEAREQGEVMPLGDILKKLDTLGLRQVLEIENEYEDGRAVYEIYFLDSRGRRMEVEVDAATGEIIEFGEDD